MRIVPDRDPVQEIIDDVGPHLDDIEIPTQYVLLGKYVRPEGAKTRGGIEIPLEALKDDRFQTKVGLVLKIGNTAFKDDDTGKFHGVRPNRLDCVAHAAPD